MKSAAVRNCEAARGIRLSHDSTQVIDAEPANLV
jgi:hypothetical protein